MRIIKNSRRSNSITINKEIDQSSKINSLIPSLLNVFKSLGLRNPRLRRDISIGDKGETVSIEVDGDEGKVFDVKYDLTKSLAKYGFEFAEYFDQDTGRGMATTVICIYMDPTPISDESPFNKLTFGDLSYIQFTTGFPITPGMAVSIIEDAIKSSKSYELLEEDYLKRSRMVPESSVGYLQAASMIISKLI